MIGTAVGGVLCNVKFLTTSLVSTTRHYCRVTVSQTQSVSQTMNSNKVERRIYKIFFLLEIEYYYSSNVRENSATKKCDDRFRSTTARDDAPLATTSFRRCFPSGKKKKVNFSTEPEQVPHVKILICCKHGLMSLFLHMRVDALSSIRALGSKYISL